MLEHRISMRNGLYLFLRDFGNPLDARPPILCLAGMTRNSKDFMAFAERVSRDGRRVICPDYRGRGSSDRDPDWRNYSPRTCLQDVQDTLVAMNIHRLVIVGTSYGGLLGMGLATLAPRIVAGLALNDIGPEIDTDALAGLTPYISRDHPQDSWDAAVAALKNALPGTVFRTEADWVEMTKGTYRREDDGKLHVDWDVRLARALLTEPPPVENLWRLYRAAAAIPVILLRGEHSNMLSRRCVMKMIECKPDLLVREIPGVGHAPTLNEPEATEVMEDFLDRN